MSSVHKHNNEATPKPQQPSPPVVNPPTSTPVDTGGPNRPPMLTREQYVKLNDDIFHGRIKVSPYNDRAYVLLREDSGKSNRNKFIDPLILRQGGDLGNAYCQFGQQDKMDACAVHLGIPRKYWPYPEGGGTQRVAGAVDSKYKTSTPKPGCFITVEYGNSGKGHIEDAVTILEAIDAALDGWKIKTNAFNTTIDGDDAIVRDGQGAGVATRKIFPHWKQGDTTVYLRAFVDHYLIYMDAYKKFYNV